MPQEFKIKNGVIVDQGGANISGSSFISGSLAINASGSNVFTVDGTAGRLFSVDDSLSGSLFSVNTAAGLPVIEAFSDNTIRVGQYGKQALFVSQSKVGIGKENALNGILDVSGSVTITGSVTATNFTGSLFGSASYALTASFALNAGGASIDTGSFATTGSNVFRGNQTVTGSLFTSGSNTLVGTTTLTGSLLITGSTTQTGNNTLIGNTVLSGSIIVSGSQGPGNLTASLQIYGDIRQTGYHRFDPITTNIDNSISASYIYVSGSTNDLYFSQNGSGYANTTRLRWIEGNLYTGLLGGGVLSSTPGSTTFNLSSGSGIIVSLNAVTSSANPFPTIQYISWNTFTNVPIINSGSAKITYISVTSAGAINQQIVPIGTTDVNQYDTQIEIGVVLHLSGSVSTGVYNTPQLAYGYAQRTDDFLRAFGPLKVSGHTLQASGSSPTLSIKKSSGTAYNNGSNYVINPNHASLTSDPDINISKIYRYYISGSTPIIDTGIANAGYTAIDSKQYVDTTTGTLTAVGAGFFSIQRVFWIPNSPTNAFIVYYGNAKYGNLVDAKNGIDTETFLEAPNTAQNGILLGYIIIQGGGTGTPARDLLNASEAAIIQAGLFRNVGGIGSSGTAPIAGTLAGLADVSISSPTNGQPLVYNSATSKWENQSTLTATLVGNASTATTASFSSTSSLPLRGLITGSVAGATLTFTKGDGTTFDLTVAQSGTVATASYVTSSGVYGPNGSNSILSSSFAATAALAPNYVLNSSTGSFITNAQTSSFVLNSQTSSMSVASASQAATASSADNFTVRGTLTAQTIVVQTITSSTDYVTGSSRFGSIITNTHQFTGSVSVTGSITVTPGVINSLTASNAVTASYWSGSILNATSASFASTASYWSGSILNATSASFASTASYWSGSILNATSASFASTASYWSGSILNATSASFASTASYVVTALTASYVTASNIVGTVASASFSSTASYWSGSILNATSASFASTASYWSGSILNATSASFASTASYWSGSILNATSASFASTASYVVTAQTASYVTASNVIGTVASASFASTASYWSGSILNATSASFASTASYWSGSVLNATSASFASTASYWSGSILNATSASFASTASSADNFTVRGTLTAQTIVAQTITASTEWVTGSSKFGSLSTDTHQFTGSLFISGSTTQTGSLILNNNAGTVTTFNGDPFTFSRIGNTLSFFAAAGGVGNNSVIYSSTVLRLGGGSNAAQLVLDSSGNKTGINKASPNAALDVNGNTIITGSLEVTLGITGSHFGTSSWANNATSASFASTASYWSGSILNATSASFASTASYWSGSILNATSASFASTASYWSGSVLNATSASFASTASYWSGSILNATSASFATTASFALTASFVLGGSSTIAIQDEGSAQGSAGTINFTGTGVTATVGGGVATVNIPGGGGAAFPYTGSAIITGSLVVTGSTTSTLGFTGSLFGTASFSTTSSFTLNIDGGTY